jgi:hypothetical protein
MYVTRLETRRVASAAVEKNDWVFLALLAVCCEPSSRRCSRPCSVSSLLSSTAEYRTEGGAREV